MKCEEVRTWFDRMYREGDRFDGKPVIEHMDSCVACRREFGRWRTIARELTAAPSPETPPELYTKVIREIELLKQTPEKGKWWFRVPHRQLYPAPVVLGAVLLLLLVTGIIVVRPTRPVSGIVMEQGGPSGNGRRMTHFRIACHDARQVAVVGDFNGWDTAKDQLVKNRDGVWEIDMHIDKGWYQYLFLVDGTEWRLNPADGRQVPDGFGGFNMVLEL